MILRCRVANVTGRGFIRSKSKKEIRNADHRRRPENKVLRFIRPSKY